MKKENTSRAQLCQLGMNPAGPHCKMAAKCGVSPFRVLMSLLLQNRKPSLVLVFLLCYKEPLYVRC